MSLQIAQWRHKLRTRSHNYRSLVSLKCFLVHSRHLGITGNDVSRAVVSWKLDQDASVLGHCEPHDRLIFRDIDPRFANKEFRGN